MKFGTNGKKVTIVGTRYPDEKIVKEARKAVEICVRDGCSISTGDAIGIDRIASQGARATNRNTRVDIYSAKDNTYPWRNHWTYYLDQMDNTEVAIALAKHIHPAWDKCGDFAKDLHSRNPYQVMGWGLLEPTDLTITFAPTAEKVTGGTRTAYMLSKGLGIPTVNLYGKGHNVIKEIWDKIFISGSMIDWDYVETLRQPISEEIRDVIMEQTKHDEALLKAFGIVYGF